MTGNKGGNSYGVVSLGKDTSKKTVGCLRL